MAGSAVKDYFTEDDLHAIGAAVTEAEKETCGEIRVNIVGVAPDPVRRFAEQQFFREGLQNTRDETGVLILLALDNRAIEIVADRGIDAKVDQSTWDRVIEGLSSGMKAGRYADAMTKAVRDVGAVLAEHCPIEPGDVNELSNRPIVDE